MTSGSRFLWERVSVDEACQELQRRYVVEKKQTLRNLTKDSELICLVCEQHPEKGEWCYYPAEGLSQNNRTIGHRDCVDKRCEKMRVSAARQSLSTIPGKSPLSSSAPGSVSPNSADSPLPPGWWRGWHDGVRFVFEKQPPSGGDSDWSLGFAQGVMYATEVKEKVAS